RRMRSAWERESRGPAGTRPPHPAFRPPPRAAVRPDRPRTQSGRPRSVPSAMPRRCARAVPAVLLLLGPAIASLAPAASAAPPHAPAGQAPPVVPEPHYGLLATHTLAPWSAHRPPLDGDDDHLVVLVHGLDEVGAIFSELATG